MTQSRKFEPGFSFTEVLFAVMILGIGFIMVAAIFPVAIQQARTSSEETTGAAVTRGAANYLEKIASNSTMPATGNVVVGPDFDGFPPSPTMPDFRDTFTVATALRGSIVSDGDSRYGWVPFYRRAGDPANPSTWSPFAQVIMVPVLARNESTFNRVDRQGPPVRRGGPLVWHNRPAGLYSGPGTARILGNISNGVSGFPDTIEFPNPLDQDIPSEGAYVIVADAIRAPNNPKFWNEFVAPEVQGRIYRLGNRDASGNPAIWELMPGFDFEPIRVDIDRTRVNDGAAPNPADNKDEVVGAATSNYQLTNVYFFVVGRGLSTSAPGREGIAQDVSAYTTFVNVN